MMDRTKIRAAIVGLAMFIPSSLGSTISADVVNQFAAWKLQHGVVYPDQSTEVARLAIFNANLKFIEEENTMAERRGSTMRLGMNRFGDMTNEE